LPTRRRRKRSCALGEERPGRHTSTASACTRARPGTSSPPVGSCSICTAAKFRRSRAALEALPGVGRKTANVVLNTAFGEADDRRRHAYFPRSPTAPGWPSARTPLAVELELLKVVPGGVQVIRRTTG
jgi:hypothetical protein